MQLRRAILGHSGNLKKVKFKNRCEFVDNDVGSYGIYGLEWLLFLLECLESLESMSFPSMRFQVEDAPRLSCLPQSLQTLDISNIEYVDQIEGDLLEGLLKCNSLTSLDLGQLHSATSIPLLASFTTLRALRFDTQLQEPLLQLSNLTNLTELEMRVPSGPGSSGLPDCPPFIPLLTSLRKLDLGSSVSQLHWVTSLTNLRDLALRECDLCTAAGIPPASELSALTALQRLDISRNYALDGNYRNTLRTHVYTCARVRAHTHTHIYTHAHTNTHTHTYTHTHTHTYNIQHTTHMHTQQDETINAYTHTHTHTHTRTHTNKHTSTQAHKHANTNRCCCFKIGAFAWSD